MKKKSLLLVLTPLFLLASCATYDMTKVTDVGKEDKAASTPESTATPGVNPTSPTSSSIDDGVVGDNEIKLDKNSYPDFGDKYYSDGNYTNRYSGDAINNFEGYAFYIYRAISGDSDGFMSLLPYAVSPDDKTNAGAFYNEDAIKGITDIEIKYHTNSDVGNGFGLKFGHNRVYEEDKIMYAPAHNDSANAKTVSFRVRQYDPSYIQIFTTGTRLYLDSISIKYTNISSSSSKTLLGSGDNKTRDRITMKTELEEGVTTGVAKDKNGNDKTYTYYSLDYVYSSATEKADEAKKTDPVDVINYYLLFGHEPANYAYAGDNRVNYLFGDDARTISMWSETYGYTQCVPYAGETPIYYELDIAISPMYSRNNRGIGRAIIFATSFVNYSGDYVGVFTDDHYGTFKEYLNNGTFSERFNAENCVTNYSYSYPDNYKTAA